MDVKGNDQINDLLQAHANVYNTHFGFVNSMALLSATQLGIPDIINEHGGAISLSDLAAAIKAPPSKAYAVARLMRLLVLNGIFDTKSSTSTSGAGEAIYTMTPSARLLTKDHPMSMSPFVLMQGEPLLMSPQRLFPEWLRRERLTTPFEMEHGFSIYDGHRPEFSHDFNEAMASDSRLFMGAFVQQCKGLLEGVRSVVDVGGGTGISAKMLADAFPEMKVTVLDLPHVVADSPKFAGIEFVGGDMFDSIPSGDAVLFKVFTSAAYNNQKSERRTLACKSKLVVYLKSTKSQQNLKLLVFKLIFSIYI